jgi:hypothetical protein
MAVTQLSQASGFNPGAALWILPVNQEARWIHLLDWHLNFQFLKMSHRPAHVLPESLKQILKDCEIPPANIGNPNQTQVQMIACHELLPCRWVLTIPFEGNLSVWTQIAYEKWMGLQKPSLRLFLPPGTSPADFNSEWNKHSDHEEFSVVLD